MIFLLLVTYEDSSTLEQYEILKSLDSEMANKLFSEINK